MLSVSKIIKFFYISTNLSKVIELLIINVYALISPNNTFAFSLFSSAVLHNISYAITSLILLISAIINNCIVKQNYYKHILCLFKLVLIFSFLIENNK